MDIIEKAYQAGRTTLSEYESKKVLAAYGIPVTKEEQVQDVEGLLAACKRIGYPLVLKASSAQIAHKTEKGLVRVDIRGDSEARSAFDAIMAGMDVPEKAVLVQEMVPGQRELVVGLTRDPQFGPCVMFGLGGIFTEILEDVAFRVAPLSAQDAVDLMEEIRGKKILGAVRNMAPVNREALAGILQAVGRIGLENDTVKEIDINPLKIRNGQPVAVDALIVLSGGK